MSERRGYRSPAPPLNAGCLLAHHRWTAAIEEGALKLTRQPADISGHAFSVSAYYPGMLQTLKTAIRSIPGVQRVRERLYQSNFSEQFGSFLGVYPDFATARAQAPKAKPSGFNHASFAEMYKDRFDRVFNYDYPVLFWLLDGELPKSGTRVFDLGGHVGVQYYSYAKYLSYPADFSWQVCEVPEVVAYGRKLAVERGASHLNFTSSFADGDGADVMIAAGALHYIESPSFDAILKGYARKPKHLFLNKVPLTEREGFVTLQNNGVSFVPQYVYNGPKFISSIQALGYQVIDRWEDRIHSCQIPFRPEHNVEHYTGLYLRAF